MPQNWKGGKKTAQARYRKKHAEKIKQRKKDAYQKNKEKHCEYSAKWRREHPERWKALSKAAGRRLRKRLRLEMVEAYGGKCNCCGESEFFFLDLDHIYNNGNEDRKVNGAGAKLLGRLKKMGWPKEEYQLLCCNCNQGKKRNGGICPHKTKNP